MATDWSKGKRGPVIPPDLNKTRITIRLDTDIIQSASKRPSLNNSGMNDSADPGCDTVLPSPGTTSRITHFSNTRYMLEVVASFQQ